MLGTQKKRKSSKAIDFSVVKKIHVKKALKGINPEKIPKIRKAKTNLEYNRKRYPAKYILELAYKIATKNELQPGDHTGGDTSAKVLHELGFTVLKNNVSWASTRRKVGFEIYRVFLKGTYDVDKGEYNNPEFNEWVSKHGNMTRKRIDAIFREIDKNDRPKKNSFILFPACTLVFRSTKEKKKWSSILQKKSKNIVIIMGILDKTKDPEEYIAVWADNKYYLEFQGQPKPQDKLPGGKGWVFISSNIDALYNKQYSGKYAFDLGHGAYIGRHWNMLKTISEKRNMTIILTSWYENWPLTSWIYKNGKNFHKDKMKKMKDNMKEAITTIIYEDKIQRLNSNFVKDLLK